MVTFDPNQGRTGFGLDIFKLRRQLGRGSFLSQKAFADRFGLTLGMVKDQEQSRCKPSRPLKVLLAAIELEPELMAKAARVAAARWPD